VLRVGGQRGKNGCSKQVLLEQGLSLYKENQQQLEKLERVLRERGVGVPALGLHATTSNPCTPGESSAGIPMHCIRERTLVGMRAICFVQGVASWGPDLMGVCCSIRVPRYPASAATAWQRPCLCRTKMVSRFPKRACGDCQEISTVPQSCLLNSCDLHLKFPTRFANSGASPIPLTPLVLHTGARFTFQTPAGRKPSIATPDPSSSSGSLPPISPSLRYIPTLINTTSTCC
jgi:hypothetical protein